MRRLLDLPSSEVAVTLPNTVPPSEAELQLYSLGKCEPLRREQIEAFLATGPDCTAIFRAAPEDPLVGHLRGTGELPGGEAQRVAPAGYEILGELGRGGMGVVYRARHRKLNRVVALKMILAGGHAGLETHLRFLAEAEVVARLKHPNIVQVYDVGEAGGLPYFSLEFVEGGSLDTKLSGTPLPADQAAAILEKLARAMAAAHAEGLVHRDLKPANVLLTADGTPKITDFGLAKKLDTAGQTASGAVLGTPSYMAPEQASGRSKEIGPACDVYALGATLYECLTGRPPFRAATQLETILQVIGDEPAPVRQLNARTPVDLETICLKCLQKETHRRYASAAELADDLRRYQEGRPIRARPVGRWGRAAKWVRRNPAVAALTATVAVALLLGASVAAFFAIRANENAARAHANEEQANENARQAQENADQALREKAEADSARALANKAREATEAARGKLQDNLYYAEMNLAGQAAEAVGGIGRVNELLEHWRPTGSEPDRRGWEWYYLRGLGQQSLLTLHRHTARILAVTWSPDGRRLASTGADETIKIWDASTGRELLSLPNHSNTLNLLAWSPDGRRLAGGGRHDHADEITLWDPDTGRHTATLRGHSGAVLALSWAPGGQRLVSTDRDHFVRLWDVETARQTDAFRAHTPYVVGWSPDGRHIALAGNGPKILLRDTETKRDITLDTGHTGGIQALSWSPTGRILASGSNDSFIRLWDFDQKREVGVLRGHTGAVEGLSWNRDGLRLASASGDQSVRVWDVKNQRETTVLRGHTSGVRAVAWSPDGRRLVSAGDDQTVRVWEVGTSPDNSILRGHTSPLTTVRWAPDSRRLASAGLDRTIRVWDADAGRETANLSGHTNAVTTLSWSPDGRRLASGGRDGTLRLWDVATGRGSALFADEGPVNAMAWSPEGRRLATWNYSPGIKVWSTDSGKHLFTLRNPPTMSGSPVALTWSPDGRRLACGHAEGDLRLWDVDSRRELACLHGHSGALWAVRWSPDGQRIATAGADQTIKLWKVSAGRASVTMHGHSNAVRAVSWSPDGRRLASASSDGAVKLWDTETGGETLTLRGPPGDVNGVSWSRDGRRLASAGMDGTVRIHDVTPGFVVERSPLLLPELDRRLQANPRSLKDLELRAEIQARLGRWEQAAADWSSAARLQGDKAPPWFQAGLWVSRAARLQDDKAPKWVERPGQAPPLHWRAATTTADGCLNLAALWPQSEPGSAFALLRLYSPREQSITALVGGAGPLRFWHDDRLQYEVERVRPQKADEGVPLTLRSGWNTLLFKLALGTGADRLYLRISADPEDRARALADRGRWDEVMALLADTLKQQPNQPEVLRLAGRFFRQHLETLRLQKRQQEASRAERDVRAHYEKMLRLQPDHAGFAADFADFLLSCPDHWEVLQLVKKVSVGGATLTERPDGSILASGKNPLPDTYTITARTRLASIAAVRLELLTDPSLPRMGPGRAENGNMHLDEFHVTAAPEGNPEKARPIVFRSAWADFAEDGWSVTAAFDGKPATGWSVWPETGQAHTAVFEVKAPIATADAPILTFTLFQQDKSYGWPHTLGRFRLSVTARPDALAKERWRAIALRPGVSGWSKLGVAHSLREEWPAALAVLQKATASPSGGSGYDRVLLGQVLLHLGRREETRKWYDLTVAWMAKTPADESLVELAVELASEQIAREPRDAGLHLQRARWHAQRGRQPKALADFARAVELDPALTLKPEDSPLLLWHGVTAARRGEWRKASADFAQVVGFPGASANAWHLHAVVLLHLGDREGYKKACAAMHERFAQSEDREIIDWLARTCILAPGAVANYDLMLRRLEKAVADTPRWCRFRHLLGPLLYRAGKSPAAVRRLNEAVALHQNKGQISDWLFLALAHHRLGRAGQARKWLDKAVREIDRTAKEKRQVAWQILRREAEELIQGQPRKPQK